MGAPLYMLALAAALGEGAATLRAHILLRRSLASPTLECPT
jgi:hypothetical protein